MPISNRTFPELSSQHVAGAKLYANRRDMIVGIDIPRGGVVAEVGVAQGDFSEFLIRELAPSKFVAIDLFEMHLFPSHWGIPSEVLFKGMAHLAFYQARFSRFGDRVAIEKGLSHERLALLADESFDLIYLDAQHDYESVSRDARVAVSKIRDDGVIVFNDYVLYDPFIDAEYGVVQAVNELVVDGQWRVVAFALEKNLFCDIAIRRHCGRIHSILGEETGPQK